MLTLLALVACMPTETTLRPVDSVDSTMLSETDASGSTTSIEDVISSRPRPSARFGDRATIKWALLASSEGEDRTNAIASTDDDRIFVTSRVGVGMSPSSDFGSQLTQLDMDGEIAWTTVVATAMEGVELNMVSPTEDGGAWACGTIPGFGRLLPGVGALSDDWRGSFMMIRFDDMGEIVAFRALGSSDAATIEAGCGVDELGRLVVDGTVNGGPVELQLESGRIMMPTVADRGFVIVIGEDGSFERLSTWDAMDVRRMDSLVQADGSVVQLIRYTGVPLDGGTEHLMECPEDEVCGGLLAIDPDGSMAWSGSLGPMIGASASVDPTPDGGFLLVMPAGDGARLPSAGESAMPLDFEGSVVARYNSASELEWAQSVGPDILVEAAVEDDFGQTMLAMWTGTADALQVGSRTLGLSRDAGTIGLAMLDETGEAEWVWAASGPGTAWPTALSAVDGDFLVTGVVRGVVSMDAGGPTATRLESIENEDGELTGDMMVARIQPRRRD